MAPTTAAFKPLDLPKANFDFANSFDGSAIPPPPPSPPPQATPSPQQLKLNGGLSSHPTTPTADVEMKDANGAGADAAGMPPPAKKQQLSPASPGSIKRPSSVRKLLSLRSLREKDRHQQALASPTSKISSSDFNDSSRPGSPYGAPPSVLSDGSARPSLAKKRSSGWFGSRRRSGFFGAGIGVDENGVGNGGAVQPPAKPRGPPPPSIPELEFKSIDGALSSMSADDLFKNIK